MIRTLTATGLALAMLVSTVLFAKAQDVSSADQQTFQDVITSQIEAFRADDGARAYSFAAPVVKSVFTNPAIFMQMVRKGYQPVYRPQSFSFGDITDDLGFPTQVVHVIGPDNRAWKVFYAMQQQDDGSWKISAVAMVREQGLGA